MVVDTSTATGKLMLNVIGAVAQFEREMMLERATFVSSTALSS